ncbi:D-arginine dehydrogenase [Microvirga lupini]|uniref:D-arginine dehydrogenase n=1 Tax=Microvirga lupini TaxID=420324 RepID=A0A7W4VQ31_9HYPH|nr:D-arginine dehydrogenase [Microvirga lupini]
MRADVIEVDVAVVGAGIAGASVAAHLAIERSVLLLEQESHPGYHTSGRSAALFSEAYGNAVIRGLSVASRSFLEAPPSGFSDYPLLSPRGALHVGSTGHEETLESLLQAARALVPSVRAVSADEAKAIVPVLRRSWVTQGVFEPDARDIDTNSVLHGFLRLMRERGGRSLMNAEVIGVARTGGDSWLIETKAGAVRAPTLVNAAGAWCDAVAMKAGIAPIGLCPLRRTAFLIEPPADVQSHDWPLVIGADEDFYFKPDAGMLLASPADESPSPPCDVQPDDMDVAVAIERIQTAADLPVRRVARRWAGLRTFASDRTPVVGYDPSAEGFFWLAGQGGYGFQTAPALARSAAALALGQSLPSDIQDCGVTAAALSPDRFRPIQARRTA